MEVNLKDVFKIELKENELLWITLDKEHRSFEELDDFLKDLNKIIPEKWKDKIVVGCSEIKLTKITKQTKVLLCLKIKKRGKYGKWKM